MFFSTIVGAQDSLSLKTSTSSDFRAFKNSIKLEFIGRMTVAGLVYERVLLGQNHQLIGGIGYGMSRLYARSWFPNLTSLSLMYKYRKYKVAPFVGIGSSGSYTNNPYPSTSAERRKYIGNEENIQLYISPLSVIYYPIAGVEFTFSKRWMCSVLYSPYFTFQPMQYFGYLPEKGFNVEWAAVGINVGYSF